MWNWKFFLTINDKSDAGSLKILMDEEHSIVNLFEKLAKSQFPPNSYGFNLVVDGRCKVKGLLVKEKSE